jgi:hypothetical protein
VRERRVTLGHFRNRNTRTIAAAVAAAYVVLALLLVSDFANYREAGLQVEPRQAYRLVDVAEGMGRVRAVNPVIGVAALEAGGPKAVLALPRRLRDALNREPDEFRETPQATLQTGLIAPIVADRVKFSDYESALTAEQAREIETHPDVIELPMDVWALPSSDGQREVRLYTDPDRLTIYVVPKDMFEGGTP